MPSRAAAAAKLLTQPERTPVLGIDLDGTITDAIMFFRILTQVWPGKVYVITMRSDLAKTQQDLEFYGIRYDEIALVRSFADKAPKITELGVTVFFDDQDEAITPVPSDVTVFKIRNGGNYEFCEKLWLYSDKTGRHV